MGLSGSGAGRINKKRGEVIKMKQKKLSSIFMYFMVFALMAFCVSAAQLSVDLGTAGDYVILTKTGISTTGVTAITGDIGVSPIDHTAITGFDLIGVETTDTFLTSALVTGKIYAANLVPPTPSNIGTSVSNMEAAFTDAQGRTHTTIITDFNAGDISGMTLTPGVSDGLYKWSTGLLINSDVTLSGSADDVFIFQIAGDLTVGPGAKIILDGVQAKNVFWAVDGPTGVSIGTTAHVEGNILASKAITLSTGATLNGRALSQTAVTLDANAVTAPTVILDTASPVIVVTTEDNLWTTNNTPQINFTLTDEDGVLNYTIFVDGAITSQTGTVNSGEVTLLELDFLANGTHSIVVQSTDSSLNVANSTALTINIGECTESWTCNDWSTCTSSPQTRTCTDANVCGTTTSKPVESQTCTVASTETSSGSSGGGGGGGDCRTEWICSEWGACVDKVQTKTCSYATNYCKPTTTKPVLTQSCGLTTTAIKETTVPTTPQTTVQNIAPTGGNQITGMATTGFWAGLGQWWNQFANWIGRLFG